MSYWLVAIQRRVSDQGFMAPPTRGPGAHLFHHTIAKPIIFLIHKSSPCGTAPSWPGFSPLIYQIYHVRMALSTQDGDPLLARPFLQPVVLILGVVKTCFIGPSHPIVLLTPSLRSHRGHLIMEAERSPKFRSRTFEASDQLPTSQIHRYKCTGTLNPSRP